jgi:hypothetical protein
MTEQNGALFKDARVDKIVTWVVAGLIASSLAWVGSELNGMRDTLQELRLDVVRNSDMREAYRVHIADGSIHGTAIADLNARLKILEMKKP